MSVDECAIAVCIPIIVHAFEISKKKLKKTEIS